MTGNKSNNRGIQLVNYVKSVLANLLVAENEDKFVEVKSDENIYIYELSESDTVLINLKEVSEVEVLADYLLNLKQKKPTITIILLFASEDQQALLLKVLSVKKYECLTPRQMFFDEVESNLSGSGFCNNLKFGLICTSHIYKPPLNVYNGNLSNLKNVVEKVSPEKSNIVFVTDGSLPIIDMGYKFSNVVYYGDRQAIERFKKGRDETTGKFDEDKVKTGEDDGHKKGGNATKPADFNSEMEAIEKELDQSENGDFLNTSDINPQIA